MTLLSPSPQVPVLADVRPRISFPPYERSRLRPGVVHLGLGCFHRAHQLSYFDTLARLGVCDWGVVGVGIRNRRLARVLDAQDNLFTLVERSAEVTRARVIGVLLERLLLADDGAAVVDRLADPQTRLVTLTITGDGYQQDGAPGPVFAAIAAALERRRHSNILPFTVLSCDNLPGNGAAAKTAVLAAARSRDGALAEWIATNVAFPDSMVDRITPATTVADRRLVEVEFGYTDGWPVVTEPFTQWVVEDRFGADRPPLDLAGVRFTDDVTPYKLIKSRMLNGAHCALGYVGALAGHRRTDDAMRDPVLAQYVDQLLAREIAPSLPKDVPGMAPDQYRHTLLERFRNPAIGDPLSRLCGRGSTKMPSYLLPSVHDAQAAGRPRTLLLLAVAGWLRYLRGTTDDGRIIDVQDARAGELTALARATDPRAILRVTDIFGELAAHPDDVALISRMLEEFDQRGVTATIRRYL
jgi:mannitol-1-phosphate/altronate dehydrogenase